MSTLLSTSLSAPLLARTFGVTTAVPYVDGAPHLGHALEFVDVLARHARLRGRVVRLRTGTDDNALKNVAAARAAGVPVAEFVAANAARFVALREPLSLSVGRRCHPYREAAFATADRAAHECGHRRRWLGRSPRAGTDLRRPSSSAARP